ncbi:MAG: efflux RND transporter permease subunit, partial [Candidatus Eisenbacteria bacterium]|nr:efflux RND transporter permease subunit [Candidatus Eisenbacteria bacterium]
ADVVFAALDQLDDLSGAGTVRTAGLERLVSVRQPVDLRTIEEAVVARRGGRTYRLGELASVRQEYEDPQYFVRANGKNVVQISVEKRSGANTVGVSRDLRAALPHIEQQVPFEVSFHINADQGKDLEEKLIELVERSAAILALLFILLALSLRQVRLTGIVIASIFFAIVISLSLFYFFRLSVNFITISGLTVCFGMILDNSILVLDSIHRRIDGFRWRSANRKAGRRAPEREPDGAEENELSHAAKLRVAIGAILAGTREVTFPIIATTATTVVAFVSFIFLSGRLSLYYVPLAVSVATAMIASLFVAFAWLPVVLQQGWVRGFVRRSVDGPRQTIDDDELAREVEPPPDLGARPPFVERLFQGFQHAWIPITLGTLVLIGWTTLDVYRTKVLKGGFWQIPDPQELFLYLEMPAGTDVEVTSQTLLDFESLLDPVPEGCRVQSTSFGNQAVVRIDFEDELLATHYPLYYRELLVEQADKTGGTSIFIRGFSQQPYFKGTFGGSGLNSLIKITGYNSKTLREIADKTLAQAERSRRVRNARITSGERFSRANQEEVVLSIDRDKLAQYDLSMPRVIGDVRRLLGVDIPWRMRIEGDQELVQLVYEDAESIEYSELADRVIQSPGGEKVRLGDLVTLQVERSAGDIIRDGQRYALQVNWEYVGTDRMRSSYLKGILDGIQLPYGYAAEEAEQQFFTQEEEEELTLMIVLAAMFIFMVLAALFESIALPLLVMSALPMSLVGVFLIFWLTSSSFDSSARIGLVLLFGVVVNNAILLVSRFRHEAQRILAVSTVGDPGARAALFPGLRKELGGSDLGVFPPGRREALLRRAVAAGTHVRLRSILLTSGTTIVGLLPLLLFRDTSEGRDIWVNLALCSIGGLASSTILILLVLPAAYYGAVRLGWSPRVQTGVRVGLAAGTIAVLTDLLLLLFGPDLERAAFFGGSWSRVVPELAPNLPLALALLAVAGACLVFRHRRHLMSFRDGLLTGLCATVVSAVIYQTYALLVANLAGTEIVARWTARGLGLAGRLVSLLANDHAVAPSIPLLAVGIVASALLALVLRRSLSQARVE